MMLTGKYGETRIRELHPRILVDNDTNRIKAKDGMLCLIYKNGGTIPDRGYFNLRIKNTQVKIGELDEEFVWERRIGDTFLMGAQHWQIESIDDQNVEVSLWHGQASMSPFWKADAPNRSYHISSKASEFLEKWNDYRKNHHLQMYFRLNTG
jgi:ATP-dependent Lhr-like helicase